MSLSNAIAVMSLRVIVFFLLVTSQCSAHESDSELSSTRSNAIEYYITPSADVTCSEELFEPCMTIVEYFQKTLHQKLFNTSTTLHFLSGEHILPAGEYSLAKAAKLNLTGQIGSNNVSTIVCNDSSISFLGVDELNLQNLRFASHNSKGAVVSIIGSQRCQVVDIEFFSASINLNAVKGLAMVNFIIQFVISESSLISESVNICNTTGVITNLTVVNNAISNCIKTNKSSLIMDGTHIFTDNTCNDTFHDSNVTINGHIIYSWNTGALVLLSSHFQLMRELSMHHNTGHGVLVLLNSILLCLQANINISHNTPALFVVIHNESNFLFNGSAVFHNNSIESKHSVAVFFAGFSYVSLTGGITFSSNSAKGSGGIMFLQKTLFHTLPNTTIVFTNNNALNFGCAIITESSVKFQGINIFANNSFGDTGGLLSGHKSNVSFFGTNIFTCHRSRALPGHLSFSGNSRVSFNGTNIIERAVALLASIISVSEEALVVFKGFNMFAYNSVSLPMISAIITIHSGAKLQCHGENLFIGNKGGGISFYNSGQFVFSGRTSFMHNSVTLGAVIFSFGSFGKIAGELNIVNNSGQSLAEFNGAMELFFSGITINGTMNFINNSATYGAGIYAIFNSNVTLMGKVIFEHNVAQKNGGGIVCVKGTVEIIGQSVFMQNEVIQSSGIGGAIQMVGSKLHLKGSHSFYGNKAPTGGAISLMSDSKLDLEDANINFSNNSAGLGGALYVQDTMSPADCSDTTWKLSSRSAYYRSECFFSTKGVCKIQNNGNHATNGGKFLYGGKLNRCNTNEERGESIFLSLFDNISKFSITSQPYQVCSCENNKFNCQNRQPLHVRVIRGQLFSVSVKALDQLNQATDAMIRAELPANSNKISRLGRFDSLQVCNNKCTSLQYRVYSENDFETVTLYAEGPCSKIESAAQSIVVTFLPCPDGFQLDGDQCTCSRELQKYGSNTIKCNVDDQTIEKVETFWVGGVYDNNSYTSLMFYPHCPFDYCHQETVKFSLVNSDKQCNFNRSGILCGQCKSNYSLMLGGSQCSTCSDSFLALILVFMFAGVTLVIILTLLKLTVTVGTINGLIFYANIIALNKDIFFLAGKFNWLKIFIAWLNLDLGIEVCFFDGMDTYVHTWLQFLFPFYIWTLVGVIIFISHHSTWITRRLGSNPVAVLATLFLLSYAKLLRTITTVFYFAKVEYSTGQTKTVWLYDGNIPYIQGKHIPLFIFALVVQLLFVVFLPYNLLIAFSPCLQKFSGKIYRSRSKTLMHKLFVGWYEDHRIQAFMDAYNAPYNLQYRYWTGLFLLIRCVLFLVFAVNAFGNPSTNLLAISITTLALFVANRMFIKGRVYKNWFNDILESLFLINLGVFSIATYHSKSVGGRQELVANILVGAVFAIFIAIIIYHLAVQLKNLTIWKRVSVKFKSLQVLVSHTSTGVSDERLQIQERLLPNNSECGSAIVLPTRSILSISHHKHEPLQLPAVEADET